MTECQFLQLMMTIFKKILFKVMFYFISCKIVPYDGSYYKNKIVSISNLRPLPHKPVQSGNRTKSHNSQHFKRSTEPTSTNRTDPEML